MFDPLTLARLTYILGVTNLVTLGLVFISCRCLVGNKFVDRMLRYSWYQKFYRAHCKWWYLFFASVILHTLIAFTAFGNPFIQTNNYSASEPRLINLSIGDKVRIKAEVAETQEQKEKGLSGRESLGEDAGMYFPYEKELIPKFWMKDMLFPIDIIWFRDGKIVQIHENVGPPSKTALETQIPLYQPEVEVDAVLEVNAGWVERTSIDVGEKVEEARVE